MAKQIFNRNTGYEKRPYWLLLLISLLLISCTEKKYQGKLIVTGESPGQEKYDFNSGKSWRYSSRASLLMVDPASPKKKPLVLTSSFFSACSPDVSFDGKMIVFAGKLNENDHWQIYEMKLRNQKFRKIIGLDNDCTDPVWLPEGKILFSMSSFSDSTGLTHMLFSCNPDGTGLQQLTFHPHADFASSVIADGRVVFITRRVYPSEGNQLFYVMRPDGTKADKYFSPGGNGTFLNKAREAGDGTIFFIESENKNIEGGKLFSVHRNRPLHTRKSWPAFDGNFRSLFVGQDGNLFISFRPFEKKTFGVYRYDITGQKPPEPVYITENYNLTDVVVAEVHPRQKKLPSAVDMGVKTGQIMCQDVNITGIGLKSDKTSARRIKRVEFLGVKVSYGMADIEKDGSFYVKIMADMPFRIRALDENGNPTENISDWLWMRPNERRGCVGCHEDPELVPDNRVPMAVKKFPVLIPQHVEKIKEKSIDLE